MSPVIANNSPSSNWTRLLGGLKALGGVGETIAGGAVTVGSSWTGIGAVAGSGIAAHGLDTTWSGIKQIYNGNEERSYTAQAISEIANSQSVGDIADAGIGFFGSAGAAFSKIAQGFSKIKIPSLWKSKVWRFGELPYGVLGSTDPAGNIIIQNGLKGSELTHVLDHEMVHRFFSPAPNILQKLRAQISTAAYGNSQLFRFAEETIAETYSSGSLKEGMLHPLINGYDISLQGLTTESTVLGGVIAKSAYMGSELSDD